MIFTDVTVGKKRRAICASLSLDYDNWSERLIIMCPLCQLPKNWSIKSLGMPDRSWDTVFLLPSFISRRLQPDVYVRNAAKSITWGTRFTTNFLKLVRGGVAITAAEDSSKPCFKLHAAQVKGNENRRFLFNRITCKERLHQICTRRTS